MWGPDIMVHPNENKEMKQTSAESVVTSAFEIKLGYENTTENSRCLFFGRGVGDGGSFFKQMEKKLA